MSDHAAIDAAFTAWLQRPTNAADIDRNAVRGDDPNIDRWVSDNEAELMQQRADDRTEQVFR